MRKAFSNNFVIEENGLFYGVSLGYDYCAEHEWGIAGMRNQFGIDNDKFGVDGRTITKGELFMFENKKHVLVRSSKPYGENQTIKEATPYGGLSEDLSTFWDKENFCIAMKNTPENKAKLSELVEAVKNKDFVISFIKSEVPVFANSSLCVLIKSRLPQEILDQMMVADKSVYELVEYEKHIGVADLKEKAKHAGYKGNHYFMACSPSWIDYENAENREKRKKEMGTKYDIMFWVNYSDDDYNYGWYTAENIIKWLSTPGLKLKSLNDK